jgi:hypothetical protein
MSDIWARVDEAIDTDPLQLRDIVAELLSRAETAEAGNERLRARHQPRPATQLIRCVPHSKAWSGNLEHLQDCPDCRVEATQVCSNMTCCTWPCEDRRALNAALDAPESSGDGQ